MFTDQVSIRPLAASGDRVEAALAAEVQRLEEIIGALDDRTDQPAGRGFVVREKEGGLDDRLMEQELLQRCQIELQGVYLAMDKLQNGTYGLCEHCRLPIATERLSAIPAATHCIGCILDTR